MKYLFELKRFYWKKMDIVIEATNEDHANSEMEKLLKNEELISEKFDSLGIDGFETEFETEYEIVEEE